jgi:hypothetical protein
VIHTYIASLGRLMQGDCKFKASPGYIVRPCKRGGGRSEKREVGRLRNPITWMNLEDIKQSKTSYAQKVKYCMIYSYKSKSI